jgi:hypothetical protein
MNFRLVFWIGQWIREHPVIIGIIITGYFSLAGLIHITLRLPVELSIENGWLALEDLIGIGILLPRAWLIPFLILLVISFRSMFGLWILIKSPNKYKKTLGLLLDAASIIATLLILFSFILSSYPWLYAGVVTKNKEIYGTVPKVESYKDYTVEKMAIVHLITLKNWVIFQYVDDSVKNESEDKEKNILQYQNWGKLKNKGYLAISKDNISSIFLEDRELLNK